MLPFFDVDQPTDDGGGSSTEVEVLGGQVQRTCSVAASMATQALGLGSKSEGGLVKRQMDALFEVVCCRLFSKTVKINHCVGFLYLLEDITSKLTVHTLDLLPQLIAILTALITVTTVWKKALRQSSEDEDAAVEVEDGKDDDDEVVVEVEPVGGGGHHLESFLSETKLKQMRGMCLKRLNELLEVHCALEEEAASGASFATTTLDDTSVRDTVRWGVSSVSYLLLETGTLQNLPTISAASKKPPAILNFMHSALRNPAWAPEVNVAFLVAEFCFTEKPQSQRECDPKQISAIMKTEKPGLVIGKILECISFGTGQYKSSAHQGTKGCRSRR